ncbi:DUF1330 domain-containing protein [Streptomyces longwoodensis]|uniref:DUF1330 domain-containing protein n=1 Tax=Streptomyces longwoodensis TaxID=68231 RepID=UPI0037012B12
MTAYAFAHLHHSALHPDVVEYIDRIQDTLDPFQGRFLLHGPPAEVVEGSFEGNLVLIAFPGLAEARAWYASPAYREILHLRTDHIAGDIVLAEGVAPDYDPRATAATLRAAL